MERVTELSQERMILVGANDPLPDDHFWFDGEGFSVYAAKQPRSTWHEHVHDCVQVTVGLEPAHMHAEWRATGRLRQSKEFIGNAVTVIPARVPHKTLAAASSVDSHLHPRRVSPAACLGRLTAGLLGTSAHVSGSRFADRGTRPFALPGVREWASECF